MNDLIGLEREVSHLKQTIEQMTDDHTIAMKAAEEREAALSERIDVLTKLAKEAKDQCDVKALASGSYGHLNKLKIMVDFVFSEEELTQ